MLLALVAAALQSTAATPDPEACEAVVDRLEVRRAVRAGGADQIIEASELIGECAGREELLVLATQSAWEVGNMEAVVVLSASALRLLEDRRCAWTPLAARLAFAAGFSREAVRERGSAFYFHVANTVHRRTDALERDWVRVAEAFDDDFGISPPDDIFAFGSAYIERPYRVDQEACGQLPGFHIRFDSEVRDTAYVVLDLETNRDGEIRHVRQILSYPGPVSSAFVGSLRGREMRWNYWDDYRIIGFSPCATGWFLAEEEAAACLPGYDPADKAPDSN
ncbi:hypothetical protein [Hyphobacterium sp.]|uniref:hypothetical protein n=1 Tax=Hyphobacterium sp. TaxID=2004662 RepID=UPI003BAD3244